MREELLNKAISFIAKHEGLRLKAYKCSAGTWTIGYGDTEYLKQFDNPQEQIITEKKAEELLRNRIEADYLFLENTLIRAGLYRLSVIDKLNNNQIIALLSLIFNIGRTAFESSTVLKRIIVGEPKTRIAEAFLFWNKITQNGKKIVSEGLVNRREEEKELFLK